MISNIHPIKYTQVYMGELNRCFCWFHVIIVYLFFSFSETKQKFIFLCFFLCYVFCLDIVVLEAFTTWKTSQNIYTSSTTSFPSKTSTIIDTDNRKIEININYLLAGGGIFLSLILFVILLQLYSCKRSTTARTFTFKKKTCKEKGETDESQEKHDIKLTSKVMPLKRTKSTINQPAEYDYYDIDEIIETRHLPNFTHASQEYELPRSLPKSKHAYLPLTVENSYLSPQFKDDDSEQREGHSRESTSDLYLQAIHVI